MPRRPRETERVLQHKFGFTLAGTHSDDHRYFELKLPNVERIYTKFSHNNKDIGPALEAKIARQLRVNVRYFNEMLDCTKSQSDYYTAIGYHPED